MWSMLEDVQIFEYSWFSALYKWLIFCVSWLFRHFEFYAGRLFGGDHAYKMINLSVSHGH